MKKHANLPIFIPHEGCPNACVFCNQCVITGEHEKADRDIRPEIDAMLTGISLPYQDIQIAFFGGSFTGLDRALMTHLLDDAYTYVKAKKVGSIRLSTRPDYISEDILDILKSHGVKSIELGLQSMDDTVLTLSKRGHTAQDAVRACRMIKNAGFEFVGQMMLGLPGSDKQSEIATALALAELGCDAARIYPTVVFENTELAQMLKSGRYTPLDAQEAVERGAAVLDVLVRHGVKPIRIGLQATEALYLGKDVASGAYDSALGEKIEAAYYRKALEIALAAWRAKGADLSGGFIVWCAPGEQSKVAGQHKSNRLWLAETFLGNAEKKGRCVKILPKPGIAPFTVLVEPLAVHASNGKT